MWQRSVTSPLHRRKALGVLFLRRNVARTCISPRELLKAVAGMHVSPTCRHVGFCF
jgi:hypothetical protein